MRNRTIEVLVDAGSAAVRIAIAEIGGAGNIELLGVGCTQDSGIRRGVIVDTDKLTDALHRALEDAERVAGLKINSAWYAATGKILAFNTDAEISIRQRCVTEEDMAQLRADAARTAYDSHMYMLHALRQQYTVDEHSGIEQPRGMVADRLGIRSHIIQTPESSVHNLRLCSERAGIDTDGFIFAGFAAAEAVLTQDERERGCCVLDIGAGTLDFIVWYQNQPIFSGSLPVGGEYASSDLAQLLRIPRAYAETLKCTKGSLSKEDDQGEVSISSTGLRSHKQFSRMEINEILRQRYREMLKMLKHELHRAGCLRHIHAGLVMTGGAARIKGLEHFAAQSCEMPVRVTRPTPLEGLDGRDAEHCFATIIGMANLLAKPFEDGVWETPPKQSIIERLTSIFKRH